MIIPTMRQISALSGFSPGLLGLECYFDASSGLVKSGSTVTAWNDETLNANNLTASGTPQEVAVWRNGQPAVLFNGSTDFIRRATLTGGVMADPYTIFVVGSWDNDAGTGPFVVGHASTTFGIRHQGTDPTVNFGTGNINSGTAAPASGTPFLMIADAKDGAVKIRFEAEGVAVQSVTSATNAGTWTGFEIGSANNGTAKWAQHVAAAGAAPRILTDTEKDSLALYFKKKYSITPL